MAIIEDKVTIIPNVIIGSIYGKSNKKGRRHAHIKNISSIGANASVTEPVTIGEFCTIGA